MRIRKWLPAAMLVALVSGCAVNETATVSNTDGETTKYIESNGGFLAASLSIKDVKTGKAGDLMRVQASIENGSRSALSFRYKFKWLDADGFEVELNSRPWTPLTITPYETKQVQAVAPNSSAVAFKVLVQD